MTFDFRFPIFDLPPIPSGTATGFRKDAATAPA
jgi:hypothetical protein